MLKILMFCVSVALAEESELSYKIQETHTMESPVAGKEMEYWQTGGSAIFTKNNIVLVPEV